VKALRELEQDKSVEVFHLREMFSPNEKDEIWIQRLAKEGNWIVVSGDPRITRGKIEREAWHASGLTMFFCDDRWSSKQFWKQMEDLLGWWPKIKENGKSCGPGTGFLMYHNSTNFKKIFSK